MTYWITEVNDNEFSINRASGIIANRMAAESVSEAGFRILHYPRMYAEELEELGDQGRKERLEALLDFVLPDDVVIIQYPMWTNSAVFEIEFVDYLKTVRKAKVAALVWDIVSWIHDDRDRDYSQDASLWTLNKYDLVIAPNPKMAHHLANDGGVTVPMISMGLTDFIYHGPLQEKKFISQLYYVGTGIDRALIDEYSSTVPIKFIGPHGDDSNIPDYIQLLGPMISNLIPSQLEGGFGLLYYPKNGSYKGMNHYGEYNNPMKLSLYLASGLPVIIMATSAHADWVKNQGMGLVINSLSEIDDVLANISSEDYNQMLENIKPWQEAITTGFFSKRAAIEAVGYLELGFTNQLIKEEA